MAKRSIPGAQPANDTVPSVVEVPGSYVVVDGCVTPEHEQIPKGEDMKVFPLFAKAALHGALIAMLLVAPVGVSGCASADAVIQGILNDLPTILAIAGQIITIVGAVKGVSPADAANLQTQAATVEKQAVADLGVVQEVLSAYKTGLGAAPAPVIAKLDAAVNAVEQNLQGLEQAFHIADPNSQVAIAAVVGSIDAVLLGVTSLLPVSVIANAPHAQMALHGMGISPGAGKYIVPSPNKLASEYNKSTSNPYRVHVPWHRVLNIPVMP